jgi:hypothetical protein
LVSPTADVLALLREQRRRADSLLSPTSDQARGLSRLYSQRMDRVQGRLARLLGGRARDELGIVEYQRLLDALRHEMPGVAQMLHQYMEGWHRDLQVEAAEAVNRDTTQMGQLHGEDRVYKVPKEPLIARGAEVLAPQWKQSASLLAARALLKSQRALTESLPHRASGVAAIDHVRGVLGNQLWDAQMVARTEAAQTYNTTYAMGADVIDASVPDLMRRWTERVDDTTGLPFDKRVYPDSLVMHGQVAGPGERFVMPFSEKVRHYLRGKSWLFPPNRPNDRAVISTWRPSWSKVPAYRMVAGQRVDMASGATAAQ